MSGLKHWRRPLKDGGVEFFFSGGNRKMNGSVDSPGVADELQRIFEGVTGCALPSPEMKAPRGKGSAA